MYHSDDVQPSVMSTDLPAGGFLLDVREDDEWVAGLGVKSLAELPILVGAS